MFAKSISLMSVCGVVALVGCVQKPPAPSPGPAPVPAPGMATSPGCHQHNSTCVVDVKVDSSKPCGFAFTPDELQVKKTFKDFVIVWRLHGPYEFREGSDVGDGVKFAKEPPNGEFTGGYATDNDDGGPPSTSTISKHRFRWVYKNLIADQKYNYLVQFHAKHGSHTPIICDPAISNLGGN